ncbi:MAG: ABC transporter permease, partial [Gaiellaceae bacterium]
MFRYLAGRMLWAASLVVVVSIATYVMFFLAPGPDLSASNGYAAATVANAASSTTTVRGSAIGEYFGFVHHVVQGDLGRSRSNHATVAQLVGSAIPATASLAVGGVVAWLAIALLIGVWSALRPRSLGDKLGTGFVLLGISAHPLWLSLVAAWFFGYLLGWLPPQGYCDMFEPSLASGCGGPVQWTYHLILPWLVFGSRATLIEVLQEDYIRTARAKGLSDRAVVRRHAFRNALVPLVTMLTIDLGVTFGSTMFVETAFNIPGLGRLAYHALPRQDLPVLVGVMITVSLVTVVAVLLLDVVLSIADPQISDIGLRRPPPAAERASTDTRAAQPAPPIIGDVTRALPRNAELAD